MESYFQPTAGAKALEQSFFTKVYQRMTLGLVVSAITSFFVLSNPALIKTLFGTGMGWIPFLVLLGYSFWLSAAAHRLSAQALNLAFVGLSILYGVALTPIAFGYTGTSIVSTFFITSGVFAVFSVYGYTTKKDLTSIGSLAIMGLWGIVLAILINFFLRSSMMSLVISFIVVALTVIVIAFETQRLKNIYYHATSQNASLDHVASMGAISLYGSFILLFVHLLNILGQRR